MKTITPELKAHIASGTTTLAICWRLELTNGTTMGFTNHDVNITYDGVTYEASTGFTPTQYESSSDMAVDGMEVKAFLDSEKITAGDIAAGVYDFAEFYVFKINYNDHSMGIMKIQRGWVGEISRKDNLFVAEVRSLAQAIQQQTGRLYTAQCDAVLGDSRCGVDLSSFTETGTVTAVTNSFTFADSSRAEADGYFKYGLLTWTVGNNAGRSMEVKSFASGEFELFQPMASDIDIGDQYSVYAGCNKLFATCSGKFSNTANYRGFPHIPSKDAMGKVS